MVSRVRGRTAGGDRLRLIASRASPHARLIDIARPVLRRFARQMRCTAHLGLFENEMVTYLVKEGAHHIFTREFNQLEAYCTGIGKALLAQLPARRLDAYLHQPLVRITDNTITDTDGLRAALAAVRAQGYALDEEEIAEGLLCVAVSLKAGPDHYFAISASGRSGSMRDTALPEWVRLLSMRAREIERRLELCPAAREGVRR